VSATLQAAPAGHQNIRPAQARLSRLCCCAGASACSQRRERSALARRAGGASSPAWSAGRPPASRWPFRPGSGWGKSSLLKPCSARSALATNLAPWRTRLQQAGSLESSRSPGLRASPDRHTGIDEVASWLPPPPGGRGGASRLIWFCRCFDGDSRHRNLGRLEADAAPRQTPCSGGQPIDAGAAAERRRLLGASAAPPVGGGGIFELVAVRAPRRARLRSDGRVAQRAGRRPSDRPLAGSIAGPARRAGRCCWCSTACAPASLLPHLQAWRLGSTAGRPMGLIGRLPHSMGPPAWRPTPWC